MPVAGELPARRRSLGVGLGAGLPVAPLAGMRNARSMLSFGVIDL